MNTFPRTAPHFLAVTLAGVMTLAMLMGVDRLAEHPAATVQMAKAPVTQQTGL